MKVRIDNYFIILFIIFSGIGVILVSLLFIYSEVHYAKVFCHSINGKYTINWSIRPKHICNGKQIFHFSDGSWGFDTNFSDSLAH